MSLSLPQFLKSRTVWSIVFAAIVQAADMYRPTNPQLAKGLTLAGLAAAAYFRAFPSQMPSPEAQKTISDALHSLPASTSLATFGAPPAGPSKSAVANLSKGNQA